MKSSLRLAAFLGLSCLACDLPRDASGTLEHVRGHAMRVGVVENPPWVSLKSGHPEGIEVTLAQGIAKQVGAELEWIEGSESQLLKALKERHLDLVIGGFTIESPWKAELAFTRPYEGGRKATHVLIAPPGENAWLVQVERYLESNGPSVFAHRGS